MIDERIEAVCFDNEPNNFVGRKAGCQLRLQLRCFVCLDVVPVSGSTPAP